MTQIPEQPQFAGKIMLIKVTKLSYKSRPDCTKILYMDRKYDMIKKQKPKMNEISKVSRESNQGHV